MSATHLQQRLNDLINYIRQGKIMEQVVVAKWKNDKIAHERFYYDTGAKS